MKIRHALQKDIQRIKELLFQVNLIHHHGRPDIFKYGTEKYNEEQLKEILENEETPIFVATNDEDEVMAYAFCIIQQHKNNNILTDIKTLYIDDLCVDEKYRRKHLGTALLNYVFDYAKQIGCYNVTLNVWNLNQDALNFYKHNGMEPLKIYMEKIIEK